MIYLEARSTHLTLFITLIGIEAKVASLLLVHSQLVWTSVESVRVMLWLWWMSHSIRWWWWCWETPELEVHIYIVVVVLLEPTIFWVFFFGFGGAHGLSGLLVAGCGGSVPMFPQSETSWSPASTEKRQVSSGRPSPSASITITKIVGDFLRYLRGLGQQRQQVTYSLEADNRPDQLFT